MKLYNKLIIIFASITLLSINSIGCSAQAMPIEKPFEIIHTTDTHGYADRLLSISSNVSPDSLWIDTGDTFHGSLSTLVTQGESMVDIINTFDKKPIVSVGNHDMDYGINQLRKLKEKASFDIISSNIYENGKLAFTPYVIREVNDKKIAIIGITTPDTKNLIYGPIIENVEFKPILESVSNCLNDLKDLDIDYIVIAGHISEKESSAIAKVFQDKVDIILAGHDHIENSHSVENVTISNPGSFAEKYNKILVNKDKISLMTMTVNSVMNPKQIEIFNKYKSYESKKIKTKKIIIKEDINADKFANKSNVNWQDIMILNYDGNRLSQKYQFMKKGKEYIIPEIQK